MPFALPSSPAPSAMDMTLKGYGADFASPFGGGTQRVNRPGDRFVMTVSMPPMKAARALPWLAARAMALGDTVTMRVYQPGVAQTAFGSPVVASATAGGTGLPISGATASALIAAGRYFSVVRGTRRYLHQVVADATTSGSGTATLQIRPALRVPLVSGDVLEFASPTIEGFVAGLSAPYSVDTNAVYTFNFTIEEAQ